MFVRNFSVLLKLLDIWPNKNQNCDANLFLIFVGWIAFIWLSSYSGKFFLDAAHSAFTWCKLSFVSFIRKCFLVLPENKSLVKFGLICFLNKTNFLFKVGCGGEFAAWIFLPKRRSHGGWSRTVPIICSYLTLTRKLHPPYIFLN